MKKYLKLIRVKHYIKNILVFAALACSGQILQGNKLLVTAFGFFAFCAVSSCVYIINDIKDVEKDRLHPTKCKRPIASGEIPVKNAIITLAVMIFIAAVFSILAKSITAALILLLYFAINTAYSMGLKNIPIIDIVILASGFILRLLYGAHVSGIEISNWLYLTVIATAFYFALGKRRNELRSKKDENIDNTRSVLKYYPQSFLDKSMYMCLGLANTFYSLWSMSDSAAVHYNSKYLFLTAPIVLIITLKYSLNIESNSDGDPVEVLLHDRFLLILCAVYILVMLLVLYVF